MNELIKVTETNGQRLVDARELHTFLESNRQFSDWIKDRIEKYGFVENQDYTSFHNFVKRASGGSTRIEYALTIDMAKEISMVENNEKGRLARQYFIEMEKKAVLMLPKSENEIIQQALAILNVRIEEERKQRELVQHNLHRAEKQLQAAAPKLEVYEAAMASGTLMKVRQAAKMIGTKMGQNKFFARLRTDGILMESNEPYQEYIERGFFKIKERMIVVNGENKAVFTTYVTQPGLAWLQQKYGENTGIMLQFSNQ